MKLAWAVLRDGRIGTHSMCLMTVNLSLSKTCKGRYLGFLRSRILDFLGLGNGDNLGESGGWTGNLATRNPCEIL